VIDRPESPQTMIYSGYLIDKYGSVDENALDQVNNVLGGDFTSRINMNIREDKHWSYGVRSFVQNTKGQRPFLIMAPVQTDKTKESVQEITKEISSFITDKQMTEAEFDKTKQNTVMGMAGMWETNAAVNGSARSLLRYGLSDSYWNDYAKSVQKLSLNDTKSVAKKVLQPSNLSWFMAGSADKILPGLSELGMEIILIDANGNLVKKKNP
jgi:predicted Zn-dependent peptidase